jgi:hypothetical protein
MSRVLIALVFIALLAACVKPPGGNTSTGRTALPSGDAISSTGESSTATQPAPGNPYLPLPGDAQLKRGAVFIDSSKILVLESYPPQFRLAIKGSLPTPCHQLRLAISQPGANNRVDLEAYSVYSAEVVCAQVLEAFDVALSLDGFAVGKYSIWLNGELVGEIEVPAPLEGGSMKGWEIYSWQVDGVWYYSMLIGTNRNKTLQEVQDPSVRLASLEALKTKLASLARGEWVTWLVLDGTVLALPPQTVLEEVQMWADLHGLNLQAAIH